MVDVGDEHRWGLGGLELDLVCHLMMRYGLFWVRSAARNGPQGHGEGIWWRKRASCFSTTGWISIVG